MQKKMGYQVRVLVNNFTQTKNWIRQTDSTFGFVSVGITDIIELQILYFVEVVPHFEIQHDCDSQENNHQRVEGEHDEFNDYW